MVKKKKKKKITPSLNATPKRSSLKNIEPKVKKSHPEANGLFLIGFSLLLFLSLSTFNEQDTTRNWLGLLGHFLAVGFHFTFGLSSYLIAFFLGFIGWKLLCNRKIDELSTKSFYFSLLVLSVCMLCNLYAEHQMNMPDFIKTRVFTETAFLSAPFPHLHIRYNLGGVPLYYLFRDLPYLNLQRMLSDVGITITFSLTTLVSFLLLTKGKPISLFKKLIKTLWAKVINPPKFDFIKEGPEEIEKRLMKHQKKQTPKKETIDPFGIIPKIKKGKTLSYPMPFAKESDAIRKSDHMPHYQLPPLNLLTDPKVVDKPTLEKDLKKQGEILEKTLLSFGIEAKVGEINCGPTITSFEIHPSVGVKVQKIKALANDIALNLQAHTIRIIAPIPGKAAVGVEIPSLCPQEVGFKEILSHYRASTKKFQIPILLGKTISGGTLMSDLAKMPHCIIAGATGSGKSVCINTIVMSILMNAFPDEIKLLLIDPKKVELTAYSKLPHLIAPVITEAHGAYAALSWLVQEMQLRYDIFKQLGVRNITAFNKRKIDKEFEESLSVPIPEKMHAIVAIVDEFADLMMVSSSDLETPIARIAQMARAVGIHMILATQRPSREVITGLIKANFPTSIAFKVSNRINSQIILDETGAESLLGNGDMLFSPPGSSDLIRAQGAYLRDEDIGQVIRFISDQAPADYLIKSFDAMQSQSTSHSNARDELYEQALAIVLATKTASTTFLQRKLKIGYARAASLMDELEERNVIGPQDGSRPRKVNHQGSSHDYAGSEE